MFGRRGHRLAALSLASVALVPLFLYACGDGAPPKVAVAPIASSAPAPSSAPSASASPASAESCLDPAYVPAPSAAGSAVDIPDPPALLDLPKKSGDSYTVFGAWHLLHARYGGDDLRKDITIVGTIVASNLAAAPACALHKTGHRDPDNCMTEIPSFTIADSLAPANATDGGAPSPPRIRVLGWARNFAAVYEASLQYKGRTSAPATLFRDEMWVVDVPFPIPAIGAKVKVTGRYGPMFTKSSSGVVAEPQNGVLTYASLETLTPAPKPAQLGK